MKVDSDIIIVGGGLNGSLMAIAAANIGFTTIVLDSKNNEASVENRFDGRSYALALSSVRLLKNLNIFEDIISEEYKALIRSEIELLDPPNYNIMHGLNLTTSTLYELCQDKICSNKIKQLMGQYWSKKEISKTKKLVNRSGNNLVISKGLLKRPSVIKHLKQLGYLKMNFGN